jgi:hypothetical protein
VSVSLKALNWFGQAEPFLKRDLISGKPNKPDSQKDFIGSTKPNLFLKLFWGVVQHRSFSRQKCIGWTISRTCFCSCFFNFFFSPFPKLDIEHTDGKRYFTWDKTKFPDPVQMQDALKETGRRMVTIVDPHVKRDAGYYVHQEAEKGGYYLLDGNKDFDGWCWSGSSSCE